jgi:hypothetical protein
MFENIDNKDAGKIEKPTVSAPFVLPGGMPEVKPNGQAAKVSVSPTKPNLWLADRIKKLEERGRKRGRRFSIIGIIYSIIICIAVLAAGYYLVTEINEFSAQTQEKINEIAATSNAALDKPVIKSIWKNCTNDSDCVETQKDCCGCHAGGEQTAINSESIDEWQQVINSKCGNMNCTAIENCQNGSLLCRNSHCVFALGEKKAGENAVPPAACIALGGAGDAVSSSTGCCAGLNPVSPAAEKDANGFCVQKTGYFVCLSCPDGVCADNEDECSCPDDCGASAIASSSPAVLDSDNDGLTDAEELRINTDPQIFDTDKDGFGDGAEVNSGYNPLGEGKL